MIAVAGGGVLGILYGRFHDSYTRRNVRRILTEMYGGQGPFPTEVETRPEGLWAKSKAFEVVFPWSNLGAVVEQDGDVELSFTPGVVVVRARAFAAPDDRTRFLAAVRQAAGVS